MSAPLRGGPGDDEETWDEGGGDRFLSVDCGPLEIPLKVGAEELDGESRRRQAGHLLAELLALPEDERRARLDEEPRFQDPLLFELLVEAGHASLLCNPRRAYEVLNLATGLVTVLSERGPLNREIEGEGLSRALCLGGTANRLSGDHPRAESAFARAADLAVSAHGRGFFCRALGVLRWDQGRSEEAIALLHQAHRRFNESEDSRDATACLALMGLVYLQDGMTREASAFLQAAADHDSGGRPWLAAHVWLGRAFCFAAAGDRHKSRKARETAWSFYEEVKLE